MSDKLIKNVVFTGIALLFTGLTRVVYNIAVGRTFDAGTLGQVNLVISIATLLSMVVSLITENSATKFLSEFSAKSTRAIVFTLLQLWTIIGSVFLIFGAYLLKGLIIQNIKINISLFEICLPLILLIALYHFYRGCFYGLNTVEKYFKFELISTALFFLTLVITVYIYNQNLLLPFIVYYGAFSLFGIASLRAYLNPRAGSSGMSRKIGAYGFISMIGTLASTSRAYIANIFTGTYLSPEQVGYYSAAVSITAILLYAPTILGRVLLPAISSSHGQGDTQTIRKLLDTTTLWLTLVSFLIGGSFMLVADEILKLLFKPAFSEATFALQMLILGLCLSTMVVPSVSALSGTRYVMIPNAAGIIGLLISLALWPILIPRLGIDGTAIGYISGSIITSIIILYYAIKYYGLDFKNLCFNVAISLLILMPGLFVKIYIPQLSGWILTAIYALIFSITFKREFKEIYLKLRCVM